MNAALRQVAQQETQRASADHEAQGQSTLTRVSAHSRPWWHRTAAASLASLLWFSPIAITPQIAAQDAGVLAAGKRYFAFWQHVLPVTVTFGIREASAAPIVDPNAPVQFQPKVTQSTGTNGGVPVVNITAPNGAGISLNKYQSFNVDAVGLILNNSLVTGTSLTGGTVQANSNLNGRTASVILNEVTSVGSAYQSVLNGPLEVFGAPATVIVANPNGIAVRGASFTNTIGVTLSTGVPQFVTGPNGTATSFDNAAAIGYNVTGGHIQIDGNPTASGPAAGIEGTVGNLDLIGETIGINAPLYVGNTINVVAGRQTVMPTTVSGVGNTYATSANGSTNTASAINAANGNLNNGYAIDATAFGAVTAGQIQVVSTAAGMGVRADSQLAANAGDVSISANGDLSVAGTNAYQQVDLQANGNLSMSGTHQGTAGVSLSASGDINSTGLIQSGAALTATAGGNVSVAATQSKSDMSLTATTGNLALTDNVNSDGGLSLTSGGTTAVAAQVTSQQNVSVQSGGDVSIAGSLTSGAKLNVTTQGNLSVAGSLLVGTDAVLNATGGIDVGGLFLTQGNATVQTGASLTGSGSIAIGQTGLVAAAQGISLAGKLLSNDLTLTAGNSVSLAAVQAGGKVQIQARGQDGTGDVVLNGDTATIGATTVTAARDISVNGALAGGSSITLNAQNNVNVASAATVQSVNDTTVNAANGSVTSTGTITSAGALSVTAAQDISATGATSSVSDMTLNAGRDLTLAGTTDGQGNGTLQAGRDLSTQGTVGFEHGATVSAGHDVNVGGMLQAGSVTINAANSATLNNVQSTGDLVVTTAGNAGGGDIAVNGTIITNGTSQLNAARDVSVAGSMSAANSLSATAGRNVSVTGSATGAGTLSLSATTGTVSSTGTLTSTGYLNIGAGQDISLAGSTSTINSAVLTAGHDIALDGTLVGGADGTVAAGHDITGAGTSAFNGTFTLNAANDIAHTGALQAATLNAVAGNDASLHDVQTTQALSVAANGAAGQGDVSLTGTVNAAGSITTTSARDTNVSGSIATGAAWQATAQRDINVSGTAQTAGDATLTTQTGNVNITGTVGIGGNATINAAQDATLGGTITIANATNVTAGRDVALTGSVNTQGAGTITAGRDFDGNGSAAFAQGLTTTSGRDTNLSGLLQASSVNVQAGNDATVGNVESTSTVSLSALGNAGGGTLTVTGTVGAAGAITTQAAQDTSIAGKLASGSTVSVVTNGNLFVAGAIEAYGDTTLQAIQGSLSATGGINSGGALAISTGLDLSLGASTTSVAAMTLAAGRDATLNGMTVGNAGGTITAGRDINGGGTQAFTNNVTVTAGRDVALTGTLQANQVDVTGGNNASVGSVTSQTTLSVTAQGNAGGGDASVTGTTTAPGAVTLTGARDVNVSGSVASGDALTLAAQRNVAVTGGVSSVGDLSVTATTGSAALTGTTATNGALTLTAGTDAQLGGQVSVSKDINAQAGHDLQLNGTIAGQGAGNFTAANDVSGNAAIALAQQATINASHDVALTGSLQASTVTVTGGNNAGLGSVQAISGPITVTAQGTGGQGDATFGGAVTTTAQLNVQAARDIGIGGASTVGATTILNAGRNVTLGGDVNSVGDLTITGASGTINGAGATTQGNLSVTAGQSVALTGALTVGGISALAAGNDLAVGSLNSAGAATLSAQGLSGTGDVTVGGALKSGGAVNVNAARDISVAGDTASLSSVTMSAGRNLTATGALSSNAATTLTATTGNLTVGGATQSVGDLNATSGAAMAIAGGMVNGQIDLTSQGAMTLTNTLLGGQAATLSSGGLMGGGGALTIQSDINLTSGGGIALGAVQTGGKFTATSASDASFGAALAIGDITVKSTTGGIAFNGEISTGGNLSLNGAQDISVSGGTSTVGSTTITSTSGNVSVAGISSNGDANVSAGKTLSVTGTSTIAGEVNLTGQNITLAGSLQASKDITANASGTINASASSLVVANNATFTGGALSLGNLMVGGALSATGTSSVALSGSQMFVVGDASFHSQGAFSNSGNLLAQSFEVQSGSFTNSANASLASTTTAQIQTGAFTNSGVISAQSATVNSTSFNNAGGTLIGVNALTINTGTFNNANGIVSAGDPTATAATSGDLSLTISGAGAAYSNTGGQLLAQRNLQLGANSATVDVSQGTISQGGALSITAGTIDVSGTWNYGGSSVSITGLNGIVNTGVMTGTTALNVTTGGTFTNYGQVIANDLTLNGALSNAAGALFHATDTLALNGTVVNRGTVEANTLNVTSGYYDNQLGLTQTVGAMTFTMGGGTLQNTGGDIFAGTNLTINAGAVINDQTAPTGTASSSTTVGISDPSLVMSGSIGTELQYYMQMVNQGSGVFNGEQSTRTVSATLGDLLSTVNTACVNTNPNCQTPYTELPISGSVTFSELMQSWDAGQWNNDQGGPVRIWEAGTSALPGAMQTVTLTLPTVYQTTTVEQQGTAGVISAGGNITLNAGSLSNKGGQISAQGNVTLNVQSLNNGVAAPTLTTVVTDWVDQSAYTAFLTQLQTLSKSGEVGVNGLEGCEYSFTACGAEATLPPSSFTINPSSAAPTASGTTTSSGSTGMIAAGNNLSVSGGALVNAGLIYAGNNVFITGGSLTNQGGNSQNASSQAGCGSGIPNKACGNGGATQGGNPSQNNFGYSQSDATIFAGNDLIIAAGNVSNTYGNLMAGHDIVVGGVGTTATSSTPAQSLTNTSGNIIAGNDITLNVSGAITNNLPPPTLVHENSGSTAQYSGCMTAGGYKNGYCEAYVEQQSGSSSTISAGNSLSIQAGTLTNIGSLITAGVSATINVQGPIVNSAQTLNAYWHSHWTEETGMFSADKTHDVWACGSAAECAQIYGSAYTGGGIDPPTPIGNVAATIQAPNLNITSGGQIQNVGNIIGTQVQLTGQKLINGITTANTYTPNVNAPSQVISLSPLTMPSLNISVPRSGTGSLPTSTNGQAVYVDGQLGGNDIGPQDLLNNLPANLKPSSTVFYYNPEEEDALLQQAALQQTGKASFINGLTYDNTQNLSVTEQEKAILYQNAISYADANDLQVGTALTQTQINQLTQPMLWYVEQTVPDPQCQATGVAACPTITALMPQIYLPSGSAALSAGGNIEGTDVTLNFGKGDGGSVMNTGTITASDTLTVNTDSLTNEANQVNVGNIWNSVKGGYTDTTGTTVQPGGFMSAANVDLNVQTLAQIGGALQKLNSDGTVDQAGTVALIAGLQQELGGDFTQTSLSNQLNTSFVKQGGSFGVGQLIALVAAVVVSILTYGAASELIGAELGAEGGTFAAGAAATTTIDGITIPAVSAGLGNIALSAGIAGMASSVTSQLISTGGVQWGSVLEAGAVAGLTAGLTNGITIDSSSSGLGLGFTTDPIMAGGSVQSLASLAGVQSVGGAMVPQAGQAAAGNLPEELAAMAADATIQAGVSTAIEGGSFLNALKNDGVSDLAAAAAFAIGNGKAALTNDLGEAGGEVAYLAEHAGLGCLASAAEGTGCAGGAIGGAASAAFSSDVINAMDPNAAPLTAGQQAALAGFATLLGGGLAGLAGANVQGGASAAQNEALNNAGNHPGQDGLLNKIANAFNSVVAAQAQAAEVDSDVGRAVGATLAPTAAGTAQAGGGVLTAAFGSGMVTAGLASCLETALVGCGVAIGGLLVTFAGSDNIASGLALPLTGQYLPTLGSGLIGNVLPVDQQTAEVIYGSLTAGLGAQLAPVIFTLPSNAVGSVTDTSATAVTGNYVTLYRGDASAQLQFLSSLAKSNGVDASNAAIAQAEGQGSVSYLFENHALNSGESPYISLTNSQEVAETFARGPSGDQAGYVTVFKLPAGFAEPNFENPNPWEREYLVPTKIDGLYIVNQYQVVPKQP